MISDMLCTVWMRPGTVRSVLMQWGRSPCSMQRRPTSKEKFIRPEEMETAKADYAHARETYQKRLGECDPDEKP